jgi:hypothetical protein
MYKHKFAIISLLFVSLVLFSALDAKSQDPEIDKIIKEVSVDTQKGAISNYTYLMKFSYERHKKLAGRKFTRLYEAILPSKFSTSKVLPHQILLIQDSEKKITEEEIMIARQNLAKELEKAESEADNPANQTQTYEDGGYWTTSFLNEGKKIKVDILKLLQNSKFSNLQRKKIDGKDIITIDFAPKTDVVPDKTLTYLSKIEGQITIDETDKRIIKIEGFALGEFAAQKEKPDAERQKELVFLFTQTKVSEGFWFPQTIWLNFGKHPEIFEAIEIQFNFSSYKKANVDVKDNIETPKDTTETTTEEKQN